MIVRPNGPAFSHSAPVFRLSRSYRKVFGLGDRLEQPSRLRGIVGALLPALVLLLGLVLPLASPESFEMDGSAGSLFGPAVLGFAMSTRANRGTGSKDKEDSQKIRINEQRFRDFAEVASDWFWSADAELRFDYFSKPVADLAGLTVGDSLEALTAPDGGTWPPPTAQLGEALKARRPFKDIRYRYECSEDGVCWWALSGKPVFDEDGRFHGYRGVGRDITVEIVASESLLASKEAAEIANRSKSEFLASISHELRTPLNAIIGFSELMEKEVLGPLGRSEYKDYASDIRESGRHLLDLINDILDLSKIESGKASLIEDIIEVPQIVGSSITMVKGRARNGGIELIVDLPAEPPLLKADSRKLKQILVNLLSNGIKFTPEGGSVTLHFEECAGGGVLLSVVDTGIGMAPENIPIALQPFRQIDSDLNRKFEGTGLGLPLCKALCEMHGGRLEIQSGIGRGTSASVYLPAERVCYVASGSAKSASKGPAHG